MGKHARGAARSRIPASTILLGTVIVAVIAAGSWVSSRSQPAPMASSEISASAMVVSSLACTEGAGGTLVDIQLPKGAPVRTSLDACGHQEGELLAVRYPAGDPASAWIANQDQQDDPSTSSGLVPIGLGITALLMLSVVLAVWLDSRRSRRTRTTDGEAAYSVIEDLALTDEPAVVGTDVEQIEPPAPPRPAGRHALPEPADVVAPVGPDADDRRPPPVDLAFPIGPSLAASLHDELFTHRGVTT